MDTDLFIDKISLSKTQFTGILVRALTVTVRFIYLFVIIQSSLLSLFFLLVLKFFNIMNEKSRFGVRSAAVNPCE